MLNQVYIGVCNQPAWPHLLGEFKYLYLHNTPGAYNFHSNLNYNTVSESYEPGRVHMIQQLLLHMQWKFML